MPEAGTPVEDVRTRRASSADQARALRARLPSAAAARPRRSASASASACRACSTCTRPARSSARTSRRSASTRATSCSATRPTKRCGPRAASTARSTRASRRRWRRRTSTTCSSTMHKEKPLNAIFFPILTHVPSFVKHAMDNDELPDRGRHARRDEGGVHQGARLLRDARHRVPRPGADVRRAGADRAAHVRDLGRELGITEDESDYAVSEAFAALERFEHDVQEKGSAVLETVEAENRVAILVVGRPYHLDPGLNHGIPEEFQVLGYPILCIRSIPKDERASRRYFKEELKAGKIKPARHQRRLAGELLGQLRAEGVGGEVRGAPPERGAARSLELQVRPRRADLRHHRPHRRAQRDAARGAARHRRQQAGRLDQDPRQDLRALAQAPRGAARGHRRARRPSSRGASTRSGSSCCAEAERARSAQEHAIRRCKRRSTRSPRRCARIRQPRRAEEAPEQPIGSDAARQEDARRASRVVKNVMSSVSTEQPKRCIIDGHRSRPTSTSTPSSRSSKPRSARASGSTDKSRSVARHDAQSAFTREGARRTSTLLIGGLTIAHDFLVEGALKGLGYNVPHARVPGQRRAALRQGVRQPRPVQPDLLHGRQPGEAPLRPARRRRA